MTEGRSRLWSIYEGSVYRPPSEADSLILQATLGCSWNRCTFCSMYLDKPFRIKPLDELTRDIATILPYYRSATRIFLADGNALVIPTADLVAILDHLYATFPRLERVGVYAGPLDLTAKTQQELETLRGHGLGILYLGLESGSAAILKRVRKGATPEMMINAGQKARRAGLPLSAIVINGLGGREQTAEHAIETGRVLSAMAPAYIGCLTLMIEPGCPIADEVADGRLTLLGPDEVLDELERMVGALECAAPTVFRANHASNYVPLRATLPDGKARLLDEIRARRRDRAYKPDWARAL